MLKYVFLSLLLGIVIHAEYVDVYTNSDSKTLERVIRGIDLNKPNQETKQNAANTDQTEKKVGETVKDDSNQVKESKQTVVNQSSTAEHVFATPPSANVSAISKNETESYGHPFVPHIHDHNGAAMRSFWVFLGLSVIVVIYFTFRAFR